MCLLHFLCEHMCVPCIVVCVCVWTCCLWLPMTLCMCACCACTSRLIAAGCPLCARLLPSVLRLSFRRHACILDIRLDCRLNCFGSICICHYWGCILTYNVFPDACRVCMVPTPGLSTARLPVACCRTLGLVCCRTLSMAATGCLRRQCS